MNVARFLAITLTALALAPGLAHLFALPNKIALAQDQYFIAQSIYRGWALLGIPLFGAVAANAVLAIMLRRAGEPFGLVAFATLCIAVSVVIFFVWTFPANQATNNWTTVPANWQALRTQWEYSHALNAGLIFMALCAVVWSSAGARTLR